MLDVAGPLTRLDEERALADRLTVRRTEEWAALEGLARLPPTRLSGEEVLDVLGRDPVFLAAHRIETNVLAGFVAGPGVCLEADLTADLRNLLADPIDSGLLFGKGLWLRSDSTPDPVLFNRMVEVQVRNSLSALNCASRAPAGTPVAAWLRECVTTITVDDIPEPSPQMTESMR